MPFMAQGAGMAVEDGVVLARTWQGHPGPSGAVRAGSGME